jgi:hypothetical protein
MKNFTKILRATLFTIALSALFVSIALAANPVYVDDDFNSSTPGWGVDHFATIQSGIAAVDVGGTVYVAAGTYGERLTLSKSLSLYGAQDGVDPTQTGARTNPALESTIDIAGLPVTNPNVAVEIPSGVTNVALRGFTIKGSPTSHNADEAVIRMWDDNVTIRDNIIDGYFGVLDKGNDYRAIDRNLVMTNKTGVAVQPNPATNVTISGNKIVKGASPASDAQAIYMTGVNTATVSGNTGSGFSGSNGVGGSNLANVVVSGNTFTGARKGVNFWGNTTFITISNNDLSNSVLQGINIKGQDITISGNLIQNAGDAAVAIDYHVIPTQRVTVSDNDLSGALNFGLWVNTTVTETVNASGNWWGSNGAAAVRSEANNGAGADYTPWLHAGTNGSGGPGFQGDFSALDVDDDSPQTGTVGRVQEGVNLVSGSTVFVAPGTYSESVTIGESVTLTGDRGDPAVAGPGTGAPIMDGTSFSSKPAFSIAEGVSNVVIEGFEIRNYGPSGDTNGDGVVAWNTGTSNVIVRDNYMHNLGYAGVLTGNGWGDAQGMHDNWQVTYNVVQTTGAYAFDMENVKNSAVSHNVISDIPGYVINVLALATEPGTTITVENVRVEYNTITGCLDRNINLMAWGTGGADRTATVQDIVVANNTITGVFNLLIAWRTGDGTTAVRDLTIDDNTLVVNNPKGAGYAVDLSDVGGTSSVSGNTITLTGTVGGGGTFFHGVNVGGGATGTWTMADNVLDGNNVGTNSAGYRIRSTLPATAVINATNNLVTEFYRGVQADALTAGVDVNFNHCSLVSNTNYGILNGAGAMIDASYCWWGAASGPYHPTLNPAGTGNAVSDNVLFIPWMAAPNEISVVPSAALTNCATPVTYTFHVEQAGPQPIRGYDVTFQINPAVVTIANIATDVLEGTYLDSFGDGQFFCVDKGGGLYTASGAIIGPTAGATGPGNVFTVKLTPVAAGTSAIAIVSLKLRDVNNAPILVGGVGGSIQVDCTLPTMEAIAEAQNACYKTAPTFANFGFDDDVNLDLAEYRIDSGSWTTIFTGINAAFWDSDGWVLPVFGTLSEGSHTVYFRVKDDAGNWNGEGGTPDPPHKLYSWSFVKDTTPPAAPTGLVALPGYNKVHLTWTNPGTDFAGVEIHRVGWVGGYPHYAPPAPAYPATPGMLTPTFVAQTGAAAYDDATMSTARDIYYYTVFTYDCAGNYSAASSTAQDRSTSYWLGDIDPASVGNGTMDLVDLSNFALTFGKVEGGGAWNAEADFGPTDDWSRLGIPMPDNIVDFEDLMIFAMNYGVVSPSGTSGALIALTGALPLGEQVSFRLVLISREDGKTTYAVVMENASEILKGFSLKVAYGVGNGLEGVTASREMTGKGSEHFFGVVERETGVVEICVAALGVNKPFEYAGEVARIVVREETEGSVGLKTADLRDINNGRDQVTLPGGGGETPYIPVTTALLQNHPNPFNPTTAIAYEVATAGRVEIAIYDVSGSLVRTLVSEEKGVGRYTATWDGRDGTGNQVHTGVYFYRMTAPGYTSQAKKMLLLK